MIASSTPPVDLHSPRLTRGASVLALVPHYQCEEWLPDCLASLVAQTRPLDAIVVIDDGSGAPPVEIVRAFPRVTLLASAENVGPYRLDQEVIDNTGYDAYLFNDADDWSDRHRLAVLLAEAERTGAELVGSQEVRILCDEAEVELVYRPLDVNAAFDKYPVAFPLLHPTSLISRDLVQRLGGFSTGLRFSGDAELLRRAHYVARVVNVPQYCYFRRKRGGSLSTAPDTGLESPERLRLRDILQARAEANAAAVQRGEPPTLEPYLRTAPIALEHVLGPRLRAADTAAEWWPRPA